MLKSIISKIYSRRRSRTIDKEMYRLFRINDKLSINSKQIGLGL